MGGTGGKSQREQNIERMMRMANSADRGSMESLRQPDGTYRVEITGTSASAPLTDSQRAAMAAGYGPLTPDAAAAAVAGKAMGAMTQPASPTDSAMSNDQAYALFMASGGRSSSYATPTAGWSYDDVNYDTVSSIAGGTGAALSSVDNVGTAVGKSAQKVARN